MELEANVVGKRVDWANYLTLSDEHETPALRRLPKGTKPVNTTKRYQAEKYDQPRDDSHPDNKDWQEFNGDDGNRSELQSRVQFFVETAGVSKLAEDVTDVVAIKSKLSKKITKQMTVLARRMECAAMSDQASRQDDGTIGHKYRGVGKWIQTGAQGDADDDVPAAFRPSSDQIYSSTKANFNEAAFKAQLQAIWNVTGKKTGIWMPVGSSLKSQIDLFQFYIPSSLSTQSSARVTNRQSGDNELSYVVDVYDSEYGKVEIELTKWNQYYGGSNATAFGGATSATQGAWRGFILHPEMWSWDWNQKPTVHKPEYKGGSYKAAIEAILMLLCKTPIGEGKVAPSDA